MAGVARAGGRRYECTKGAAYVRPRRPWQWRGAGIETSFGGKQVDGLNVVNERKYIRIASLA